jgi:hypothetical protein
MSINMKQSETLRMVSGLLADVRYDPPFESLDLYGGVSIMPRIDPAGASYLTSSLAWIAMRGEGDTRPSWGPNFRLPGEEGKAVDIGNGWLITPIIIEMFTTAEEALEKIEKAKEILRAARPTT